MDLAQELMDHRVDPVPVARDHLVEGGLVPAFEAVDEGAIQGDFLSFRGPAFCFALMRVFLNCSQDL